MEPKEKNSHWISPELRTEFLDQYSTSEIDGNGCDVKITAINDQIYYSHGMILSSQSPIFRRCIRQNAEINCKWNSEVVHSLLKFLYGISCELESENSIVELLLCAAYYQIEWLCHKLSGNLVERLKKTKSTTQEASLNFCYKLTILLQDMDHNQRIPFDPLVGPLFEFCCNRIKTAAAHSNFPVNINVTQTVDTILDAKWPLDSITGNGETLQLLLSFFPSIMPNESLVPNDQLKSMLRNQLFGRISVIQSMMLESVKDAQRQFPTVIYYREEAAQLVKVGDKVIQEDNTPEKYFHSRHASIGHVLNFCCPGSQGIGCGGCRKHVFVDWGDQKCWCRMGYENLYELKLLR